MPAHQCPLKRVSTRDIVAVVLYPLGAALRTPTLVAKTYFAAREIEAKERECLQAQQKEVEQSLEGVKPEALKLMSPDNDDSNRNNRRPLVNQQAADYPYQSW